MKLYFNPISSYSQKVLVACYELGAAFDPEIVNMMDPKVAAAYAKKTPWGKVPTLVTDDGKVIPESTIVVEYLDRKLRPKTPLIPEDPETAREVRLLDRAADLYFNDPMATILFDSLAAPADKDPEAVAEAKETLDQSYAWLEPRLAGKKFATGDAFTLADCAMCPALGYLRQVHPYEKHKNIAAYAARLLARPSFVRVLKEAEPVLAAFIKNMKK